MTDMFAFGAEAEEEVVRKLRADGWIVTPLKDIRRDDGRGPRALAGGDDLILPDVSATKHGHGVAVEVKRKSHPSLGKLTGEPEHGIDLRYFDAYRDYERRMGVPTFLLVVVAPAGAPVATWSALIARVSSLRVRVSHNGGMPPMAYWPASQMTGKWLLRLNRYVAQADWRAARTRNTADTPDLWD